MDEIKIMIDTLIFALAFFFGWIIGQVVHKYLDKLILDNDDECDNKCDCGYPNECDKFCNAKILFTQDNCNHTYRTTRVICRYGTCETVADFCEFCNKQLTESKTDCR